MKTGEEERRGGERRGRGSACGVLNNSITYNNEQHDVQSVPHCGGQTALQSVKK